MSNLLYTYNSEYGGAKPFFYLSRFGEIFYYQRIFNMNFSDKGVNNRRNQKWDLFNC